MWRFMLSAVIVMTVLLVLFAGALGDLRSLPVLADRVAAVVGGSSPPPSSGAPADQAARDALRLQVAVLARQAQDLQQQIAERSQALEQRSKDLQAAHT